MTTSPSSALLQVDHLTMAYGPTVVLSDVSFEVLAGEVHGVLGEDGAGKTTLMKIIGGYIPANAYGGQVLFQGQPLHLRTIKDGLRQRIAIVPRKIALFDHMSVAENVTMTSGEMERRLTISRRAAQDQAEALLRRWEIAVSLGADVRTLSPVQRRQLMIANALAIDPLLLVLDEPLAGMPDSRSISVLVRMVRRMAERGVTCLYLAKRPMDVTLVADHITVLRDGAVAGHWRRDDFDEPALAAAAASQRAYDPEAVAQYDDFGARKSIFDNWFRGNGKRP